MAVQAFPPVGATGWYLSMNLIHISLKFFHGAVPIDEYYLYVFKILLHLNCEKVYNTSPVAELCTW